MKSIDAKTCLGANVIAMPERHLPVEQVRRLSIDQAQRFVRAAIKNRSGWFIDLGEIEESRPKIDVERAALSFRERFRGVEDFEWLDDIANRIAAGDDVSDLERAFWQDHGEPTP